MDGWMDGFDLIHKVMGNDRFSVVVVGRDG